MNAWVCLFLIPKILVTSSFQILVKFVKFSGHWYAVYIIDIKSSCWTYDFITEKRNNTTKVVHARNQIVDIKDAEEDKEYPGILEVPNPTDPATMTVKYPDSECAEIQFIEAYWHLFIQIWRENWISSYSPPITIISEQFSLARECKSTPLTIV